MTSGVAESSNPSLCRQLRELSGIRVGSRSAARYSLHSPAATSADPHAKPLPHAAAASAYSVAMMTKTFDSALINATPAGACRA